MAANIDIPNLQRMTFFTGQRLTAADLSEVQRANHELRWLHNRSLHGWGIGIGLGVTGERGATSVTVEPGYGVDCLGREIILTETWKKTVPAVAGGPKGEEVVYYLVAAYQSDADQKVAERRPGVCLPEGTVRLSEEPRIEWRQPGQLQEGLELILAQAWVKNCKLSRPLSLEVRRTARSSHQPYIAAGQTVAGNTDWQEWQMYNVVIGVTTQVDTSAARFRTAPRYMAHVVGPRYYAEKPPGRELVVLGFPAIVDATAEKFTLEVFFPVTGEAIVNSSWLRTQALHILKTQLKWHVVWMGIEG